MQADCAFRVSAGSFTAPTSDVEPGSDCDGGILRVPWDVLYPRRGSRSVPDVPLGSLDVTAAESIGAQLSLSFSTSYLCFSLLQLPLLARARAPIDWSEVERRVGVERSRCLSPLLQSIGLRRPGQPPSAAAPTSIRVDPSACSMASCGPVCSFLCIRDHDRPQDGQR